MQKNGREVILVCNNCSESSAYELEEVSDDTYHRRTYKLPKSMGMKPIVSKKQKEITEENTPLETEKKIDPDLTLISPLGKRAV